MRIQTKLFVALLATCFVLVAGIALISRISFERDMNRYLFQRENARIGWMQESLADYYRDHGNWEGLRRNPSLLFWLYRNEAREHGDQDHHNRPAPPPRMVLLDQRRRPVFSLPMPKGKLELHPIKVNDRVVGWLGRPDRDQISDNIDRHFRQRQQSTLLTTSALVLILAALVSWLLARHLVGPLRQLSATARRMAGGDYAQRIRVRRTDELGTLSQDLNHLALSLEKGQTAREQWLADISHELRTPVAILHGEIEALVEGIRQPDPHRLQSLHQEVLHLRKLLDDLHDLASADAGSLRYRMEPTNMVKLCEDARDRYRDRFLEAGILLSLQVPDSAVIISADQTRLQQLIDNLLENSLKYTARSGQAVLELKREDSDAVLRVYDSAPGVPADSYDKLFDYLYRVETSRNREQGGSGLGLAISRRIAEAHQGSLTAGPSSLGGLTVTFRMPLRLTP